MPTPLLPLPVKAPVVIVTPLLASTPDTWAEKLRLPVLAAVYTYVNTWLLPPISDPTTPGAGPVAYATSPFGFVLNALTDTLLAVACPTFSTVISTVTADPVPTDEGDATKDVINSCAGTWMLNTLLLPPNDDIPCPDEASFPPTFPLKLTVPVPSAVYVHVNTMLPPDARFVTPWNAGAWFPNPPPPTLCASADGLTLSAATPPLFVTLIYTVTTCPKSTCPGTITRLDASAAGCDTLIYPDDTALELTTTPLLPSFPVADTLYPKLHGLGGTDGPLVFIPVYVNTTLCPPKSTADAGVTALNAFGVALPSLIGTPPGITPVAVAWPVLLTVIYSVYACPSTTPPVGLRYTAATLNAAGVWINTPDDCVTFDGPPVDACATAVKLAVPDALKM
jgi:hypothetical protein